MRKRNFGNKFSSLLQSGRIQRIADTQLPVSVDKPALHFIINVRVNNQPAGCGAALTCGSDRPEERPTDSNVEISVFRYDDRVVPAQLEQGLA